LEQILFLFVVVVCGTAAESFGTVQERCAFIADDGAHLGLEKFLSNAGLKRMDTKTTHTLWSRRCFVE
jgi:hypothetical protein